MNEPSFSICIPNYNYGKFIGDTIRSVLDQTYQNFEIIVADNASTDDSVVIVESFRDSRIKVIRNRYNIGFAPNLQQVTREAKNDFINLLSADDQMKPTALQEYATIINELSGDAHRLILMSDAEGFDNAGNIISIRSKSENSFTYVVLPPNKYSPSQTRFTVYDGRNVLRETLKRLDMIGIFCSTVYPRVLWQAVEGYNSIRTIGPDKHFTYKLLSQDAQIAYVYKPLFRYREHVSANRAATRATIRHPIDNYLNVLEFGEASFLKPLGLTQRDLIRTMIERSCLRESLVQLSLGNYSFAFRLFAFALATYPGEALRIRRTYVVLALLLLGPVSSFGGPLLRSGYKRLQRIREMAW